MIPVRSQWGRYNLPRLIPCYPWFLANSRSKSDAPVEFGGPIWRTWQYDCNLFATGLLAHNHHVSWVNHLFLWPFPILDPLIKNTTLKKNVFFLVYSYMIIEILLVSIHSQTIKNTAEKLRPRLRSSRKALGRGPWRFVHFRENQRWGFPSMGDPQNGWFIRDNAFLMGNSHFLQFAIGNGP
jgi:hypothetical protein